MNAKYWIWLDARARLSHKSKRSLLSCFPDAESIYRAGEAELCRVPGISAKALETLLDKDLKSAQKICSDCEKQGISILTWQEKAYPGKLRSIAEPPLVLYYKGKLPCLEEEATVGVVGTRRSSAYGKKMSARFGGQIAQCGGIVVSGMADGVDGYAVRAALDAGGTAIGVLGHGVERVYPAAARQLFKDVEAKGCLISEYPPGTQPSAWTFPQRNRIISGLSDCVLVVEAPEKSGALITARYAREQGKSLYAVPCQLDSPTGAGCCQLLRSGAFAAVDGWQLLEPFRENYSRLKPPAMEEIASCDKKSVDNAPARAYSGTSASLSPNAAKLLEAYSRGVEDPDLLIGELGISVAALLTLRTELELAGYDLPKI